jgi:hypothetical protein
MPITVIRMARISFAALLAVVPLVLVQATSGSATRAFHDTVGEIDCCTRDLTDVVVRNDDAGKITFEIHFDDRVEGDDDDDLFIPLDSDRDPSTGETGDWGVGIDYIIGADLDTQVVEGIHLNRWDGSEFRSYGVRRIRASLGRGVVRLALDRHLIGDTDGFEFDVQLWEVAHGGVYSEWAPDAGSWSFPLRIRTRRLRPILRTSPHPQAGRRFVGRLALRVAGTKKRLASGRVLCRASVGGRRLEPVFAAFAGRRAVCAWHLPSRSAGKTIRGSVGVAVTSRARISRRFAATIG